MRSVTYLDGIPVKGVMKEVIADTNVFDITKISSFFTCEVRVEGEGGLLRVEIECGCDKVNKRP